MDAFDDGSEEFRTTVTLAFRAGDYSLAQTLAPYAKEYPEVRRAVLEVLNQVPPGQLSRLLELAVATGSPEVLPPIRKALRMLWGDGDEHDISEEVALKAIPYAARLLALDADAWALDILAQLTGHPSHLVASEICYTASYLLGQLPERHPLREFVRAAFLGDDADLRNAVAPHAAVDLVGVRECLEVAERLLLDAEAEFWWDSACRLLTAVAHTKLTGTREGVASVLNRWLEKHSPRRDWLTICELFLACGDFEQAGPFLQRALRQESPFERFHAIELLRRVPHPLRRALASEALADEPDPLLQRRLDSVLLEPSIDG